MAHDKAYYQAEKKIEEAFKSGAMKLDLSGMRLTKLPDSLWQLNRLHELRLSKNSLTTLPESLGQIDQLQLLNLSYNHLEILPESLGQLTNLQYLGLSHNKFTTLTISESQLVQLKDLNLSHNRLTTLPDSLGQLAQLEVLNVANNELTALPESIGMLSQLKSVNLASNKLTTLPETIAYLEQLQSIFLASNPLNLELAEAEKQGFDAIKLYLRAGSVVTNNEAKLILIGEGAVGKTCLMDALREKEWQEHLSTHGIEIQQVKVTYYKHGLWSKSWEEKTSITLNAWDFGGQRVYRPTHQLFFSAPAVYLVVWKPREGSQAGQVKEWIQLIKRREPSAKILVVATHGGPQQRQPDIDRQELWDLFGKETVVDFFFVESKPDEHGNRKGIDELKQAIAQVAASLPEVGRSVPKSFADVRQALQETGKAFLPLRDVLDICRAQDMDDEIARLFITI